MRASKKSHIIVADVGEVASGVEKVVIVVVIAVVVAGVDHEEETEAADLAATVTGVLADAVIRIVKPSIHGKP